MPSKLQRMRNVVKRYGAEYGWEWNKETGLLYAPLRHGLDYFDSYLITDDIQNGVNTAKELQEAINYLGNYELREAVRTLRRRGASKDATEELYRQRAIELIQKQRQRISESADDVTRILNFNNIYRESSETAMRQTPRVRASAKGVRRRVERGSEVLLKTLKSDAFFARTNNFTPEQYESLKNFAALLGFNLEAVADKYKLQLGDPYKALEKAYMEVRENVAEKLNQIKANKKLLQEYGGAEEFAQLIRLYGVDFT